MSHLQQEMHLGNKLKKLRELRNYTQDYIAQKIQMTSTGYGKIERGETELTFQKLEKIAKILGFGIEDVLLFDESVLLKTVKNKIAFQEDHLINGTEKKLLEQIIQQLKEENTFLKKLIENLQIASLGK
jgi:transcriptional regulator with XRE-family HTH domain